jgi:hypothetical protein
MFVEGTMIKSMTSLLIITLLCLGVSTSIFGQDRQMYSWTDEDGVVHFSDARPEGQEVRVIDIPESDSSGLSTPMPAADATDQPTAAQQRREDIARRRQENRQAAAERASRCADMRAELNRIEPNRRVYFTNEKGETERMDDVVRTDRVAELRGLIGQECDPE